MSPASGGGLRAAGVRARKRARQLLVQALYQHQLTGDDARELATQFSEREGYEGADHLYFRQLLDGVLDREQELDARVAAHADRDPATIDPVVRAVLWVGLYELGERRDVPERVAINEAIELAKRYGGEDSHRFVNALLDRARVAGRPGGA